MLGERVLAELHADRTNDTLTRWLAHHIARLITAADSARAAGSPDADARASAAHAAILELWQHRSAWPQGWPPAHATEIVRLLDDLPDLENSGWYRETVLARLEDLHHHVLGVLTDLVASPGDGIEDEWLRTTGDQLTPDEVLLLNRAATAPRRLDMLLRTDESKTARLRPNTEDRHDTDDGVSPQGQDDVPVVLIAEPVFTLSRVLSQLADAYRETVSELLQRLTHEGDSTEFPDNQGLADSSLEEDTL